ncbi:MAG TPA: S1C family serine protease [Opitutales bacterium]|nr:S1C family serine protease [Opitutales bacterium]
MIKLAGLLAAGMAVTVCTGSAFGQSPRPAAVSSSVPITPAAIPAPTVPAAAKNPPADIPDILETLQNRYTSLFDKISPAVVRVNAAIPSSTPGAPDIAYVWTGFFVSKNGDILTTHAHDLQNASRVWILCGDIAYTAEVKGLDPVTDVALLQVVRLPNDSTMPKEFPALDLADSPDLPKLGSMLLAVTCKEGQMPGPSRGDLQGYNSKVGNRVLPTLHLRTTIPADGGEDGSPVVDLQGRLVGIMVASLKESRESIVLPTRAALRVRDDLLTTGKVAYGHLGFAGEQHSDSATGVRELVNSVEYGGPAGTADLKIGDQIIQLGNTTITNEDDMRQAAFYLRPNQDVTVGVLRDGQQIQLTLHVGEMQLAAEPAQPPPATAATTPKPNISAASLLPDAPNPALPPPPVVQK